jgi:uncharacterized protein YndB with AHSA1/START domain
VVLAGMTMLLKSNILPFLKSKLFRNREDRDSMISVGSRIKISRAVPNVFEAATTSQGLETWLADEAFVDHCIGGPARMFWRDPVTDSMNCFEGTVLHYEEDRSIHLGARSAGKSSRVIEFTVLAEERGALFFVKDKFLPECYNHPAPTVASINWYYALRKLNETLNF